MKISYYHDSRYVNYVFDTVTQVRTQEQAQKNILFYIHGARKDRPTTLTCTAVPNAEDRDIPLQIPETGHFDVSQN